MPAPEPEQPTLNWGNVRQWREADVDEASNNVQQAVTSLTHDCEDLCGARKDSDWEGIASDAARQKESKLQSDVDEQVAQLALAKKALDDAATAIGKLETDVRSAESFADHFGFSVSGTGEVSDPNPPPLPIESNLNDAKEQADHRTDLINQCIEMHDKDSCAGHAD